MQNASICDDNVLLGCLLLDSRRNDNCFMDLLQSSLEIMNGVSLGSLFALSN
jgi:hypothetical protein